MEKAIIVVCLLVAAWLAWATLHHASLQAVCDFFNEPVKNRLVETDSCPSWCSNGCYRVENSLVKVCR